MKIIYNEKCNIDNSKIRWYLSSQEIWIGDIEDYKEVEDILDKCCGSINFLYSDVNTILFDNKSKNLRVAILKVVEPIKVIENELYSMKLENRKGTLILSEISNFESEIFDDSKFYIQQDMLVSCLKEAEVSEKNNIISLTEDFSFIIKNDKIVGILLKNASAHIASDEEKSVDVEKNSNDTKVFFEEYLKIIKNLDEEDEEKIKSNLKKLYEDIGEKNNKQQICIKKNILDILEYM